MSYSNGELRELASRWLEPERVPGKFRVFTDTSDFYRIDYDDVVVLGGRPYLIRNNEREGRFGIDEQQKFWVKRAIDLADGSRKILKLVFHESFKARVGPLVFDCVRSPVKEARVLDIVRSHPNFMRGFSAEDSRGNVVRVIDFIQGSKLPAFVSGLAGQHREYFFLRFPAILGQYRKAVEAIGYLHGANETHGDVRRDHIIVDRATGVFRWIDFDFSYSHRENKFGYDIFGLGNVLAYLAGGGDVTVQDLRRERPEVFSRLSEDDLNIIFQHRVVNLRKVFPYVPERLNLMLMHFSTSAETFYERTAHFLEDLAEAENSLAGA